MRHSQLSNEQILLALSESYNVSLRSQNIRFFLRAPLDFQKIIRREVN
jgi:hypothetical protein